jgi:hypothetical protein
MAMNKLFVVVQGSFKDGFTFSLPMAERKARDEYDQLFAWGVKGADLVEVMVPEGGIQDPAGLTFLVRGDPVLEGFEVIGPFTNMQDATAYGVTKVEGNWWVFTAGSVE